MEPITLADVRTAATRIAPHVWRTPLVACEPLSAALRCDLRFKAESLQHGGAFKARGACNAVFALSDDEALRGVVTHSSGNHAAALARAATRRGIPVYVVMPHNASPIKLAAVRAYGVEPILCEPTSEARERAALEAQERYGARLVHPYDDPLVMAGQGTLALEVIDDWPEIDTVVVPVSGGGLLAGVLTAIKAIRPEVQVIAAEPAWADDTARSLASGKNEVPTRYDTLADGLRAAVGKLTLPVLTRWLDDLILVEEETIRAATRTISAEARLVAEYSGAVPLAAVMTTPERFAGRRVGLVVSGGNLDMGGCRLGESPRSA
ncbi:threonine ammonia-lyase [Botrimarina hoheduenensis]|uniref:L-threonine dehydratase catabolic TdcB n=1 Tax=Botrimarina hoheduenensis TaxID=2528000 RepID=A0A5C5WDU1_9BACT|nr:threonine/serine dehydratase [Botrimarina hoheduenensis]TWT48617.1 L-threonine dehydratase catabolic TdcB [Botrimarina hoheduenensis]